MEGEGGMPGEEGPGGEEEEKEEAGPGQPEIGDVGDDDWESLLNEATAKAMDNVQLSGQSTRGEPLRKSISGPSTGKTARVRETVGGETVEYEIEF